jgi:hypothetical protein
VTDRQDPIPNREPQGAAGDGTPSPRRPIWALPALILGLLIALWIVGLLVDFIQQAWADPGGREVHTMVLGFFLPVLVPLSVILIVAGGLPAIRPWTAKRPWLRLVWVGSVLALGVSACTIPWAITEPPDDFGSGSGTVYGLPGQQGNWFGRVDCTGTIASGLDLVAKVAARDSHLDRDFEVNAKITGDDAEMVIWVDRIGATSFADILKLEPGGATGTIKSQPVSILHVDDAPSRVSLSWTCRP